MRLSFNEIRARAAEFARQWAGAQYEKGETQSFYNDFFDVFGVARRKVASFEEPVKKLGGKQGFIDLFWKGMLLVEHKSAGRDLTKAKRQAFDYFPGLKDAELPRYLLLSDFQSFELHDLDEGIEHRFGLAELPQKVDLFGFIIGVEKRTFKDQDPVNIEAAELMGRLHDALKGSGYDGHDLERFLVRLVFCLFADDTGIFERESFLDLIENRSSVDGADIGRLVNDLFEVLNTPDARRQTTLDEQLGKFPYVNGELFAERLPTPAFDSTMRALLLEACRFRWHAISPAIFGSLFQSVMKADERRKQGAHYTTEKNILKVIGPLFLDDLHAEFARLKARRDSGRLGALKAFHERLSSLTFFDPACGCGNFLIIAYRELRALEIELLKEVTPKDQRVLDVAGLSKINVDQFYGIELGEFPARIAETALWMMDHIMNNRLSLEFGEAYARIPLKAAPHIHHADALELDWQSVLPAWRCSYVLGNPPFIGQSYQSPAQRQQMARVIDAKNGRAGSLDYVGAWFLKAGAYVKGAKSQQSLRKGKADAAIQPSAGINDSSGLLRSARKDGGVAPRIGFVATNSITQGEQVAQLWPLLFDRYHLEIAFAHRTFAWGSDARGKAHVHVVIIGLARRDDEPAEKRLFSYDDINGDPLESRHRALSPYLFDASQLTDRHAVVLEINRPPDGVPVLRMGSKIVDGGHLILSDDERTEFLRSEPAAAPLICPLIGSEEYINGGSRWIISAAGMGPDILRALPQVRAQLTAVKKFRLASKKAKTRELAEYPARYEVMTIPTAPFLCVPKVSSERRDYVPIGWLEPPTIPSDLVFVLQHADHWHFAILTSAMHMAWLRHIGGRLESRYRYSIGIVYNTFPWPAASDAAKTKIRKLAQAVLDARLAHPKATLADLYDPLLMPPDLRKAHKALDLAVDRFYRPAPFASDRERVEHLFMLYEKLVQPLTAAAKPKGRRKQKVAS
jgi:hypothetical protein